MVLILRAGGETAASWEQKVEPALLQSSMLGDTEFLVLLSEQADVSGADALPIKEQKGAYVYERLTEVARRTQAPICEMLAASGVEHRAFWIASMLWVRGGLGIVRALAERSDVAQLFANAKMGVPEPARGAGAVPGPYPEGWNLVKLRAPEVWALGYTGQGVVVAGQDTGFQWDHPALIRRYRGWDGTNANHNYNWHDAVHSNRFPNPCGANLKAPCDDFYNGHGTPTMGIMVGDDGASHRIGLAPSAKWIGARNMDQGEGSPASYAECFQWFVAPTDLEGQNPDPSRAPDVINNSWICFSAEGCVSPDALKAVVEHVRAAGIVVVAGAGNGGPNCGSVNAPPAIYEAALTVGATDPDDVIDSWSSRGPVTRDSSNRLKPDVCAPWGAISSVPTNAYAGISGTSAAAPHVAGLVALLLSAHPELRGQVAAVERLVKSTAVPLTDTETCGGIPGTNIPNNTYGWGRVDALAALALGDSDSDGIPDWWMLAHFGHPLGQTSDHSQAQDDADGDRASNREEFVAGTDPLDRASYFHIQSAAPEPGCTLTLQSSVRRLYTLSSRTELAAGAWTQVAGQVDVPGIGAPLELSDTATAAAARFYRVEVRVSTSPPP